MILTVTLNPALDRTLAVPNFEVDFRHRASSTVTLPGGKGVNVARVIKRLGQPVIATGFVGGRTGERVLAELGREDILCDFVRIEGETRTSTAVLDPAAGTSTEINEHGPQVAARELQLLCDKLHYLSKAAQLIVLAGSIPQGPEPNIYSVIIKKLRRAGATIFLDTYGEPLRLGLKAAPTIVFLNQVETETAIGHEIGTVAEYVAAARDLRRMGALSAVVHGRDLVVAQIKDDDDIITLAARPPQVEVVSTVGSGDSLLGGYAAACLDGKTAAECLRFGIGCAVANTLCYGAGLFVPEEAYHLAEQVEWLEPEEVLSAGL